jgi:hypothetical protein
MIEEVHDIQTLFIAEKRGGYYIMYPDGSFYTFQRYETIPSAQAQLTMIKSDVKKEETSAVIIEKVRSKSTQRVAEWRAKKKAKLNEMKNNV